ncbi:piggyBac transposable element-derived protein 4-like [Uloborus diversus]|uniref:piggyBac transposable element-derived protein 4-like n=1 Tax=Uloborus diversus TaxID=327109 RepID=UPI00240962D7|nr:piggyBac transposable element-derived protein 4-like [Uloborus diversus]
MDDSFDSCDSDWNLPSDIFISDSSEDEEIDLEDVRLWCKIDIENPPPPHPRFPFTNIPGLTFHVQDPSDPLEFFRRFFDDEILKFIVDETNSFADEYFLTNDVTPHSRSLQWRETTIEELLVFFALIILQGIIKKPQKKMYWTKTEVLETPFFGKIMTEKRFSLLMKFLHFEDKNTENEEQVKLKKIWPVVQMLTTRFCSSYSLERDICIDESLLLFKGRLAWKQPTKRARFGVTYFVICESASGYASNLIICTGKDTEFNLKFAEYNVATRCVLSLIEEHLNKGHCLITDNFYTSPELAEILIKHKTDTYGTMKTNRKDLPKEIRDKNSKEENITAFHRGKIMVMKWQDKKPVTMLSTVHAVKFQEFEKRNKTVKKPEAVLDYNITMGGVYRMDACISNYGAKRSRQNYK